MTTAREIADWHRKETARLRTRNATLFSPETKPVHRLATAPFEHNLTDRIKLHERFAAWLEAGEHDEHEKSVARHIAALELTRPPIEAIDGGRIG